MPKSITGNKPHQDKDERWYYRFQYTDKRTGKRKSIRKICKSEDDAKTQLRKALNKHELANDPNIHDGDKMRFNALAKLYEKETVFPAIYRNQRKVGGLKSYKTVKHSLEALKIFFGKMLIREIRPSDLRAFKLARLDEQTKHERQRQASSVNRELAILRACLSFGVRESYLTANPFSKCASIISASDETKRNRVMSYDEEKQLLDVIDNYKDKRNRRTLKHIRSIFIAACDTGCRRGELFKLLWEQVDLENDVIHIIQQNTKTNKARDVGITPRLKFELLNLWDSSPQQNELSVFGISSNVNKSWRTACKQANVLELTWHDLRHCHAQRLNDLGISLNDIASQLGHQQIETTRRYLAHDKSDARRIAGRLHLHNVENSVS